MLAWLAVGAASTGAVCALRAGRTRLELSRAKHRSLEGHPRLGQRLAKLVCAYEFDADRFYSADAAPPEIQERRRMSFEWLARRLREGAPETVRASEDLESGVSDAQFTAAYRVPFPFSRHVRTHLKVGTVLDASCGVRVRDLDGNTPYDLTGSYGVNVFGYDFYKGCIDRGIDRVRALGPVLGAYHPVIGENVERLKSISGLDE